MSKKKIKIVLISDTHNFHWNKKIEKADLLLHCGDFTDFGKREEVLNFNHWLGTLPVKEKICIGGNHVYFPNLEFTNL